MAGAVGCGTVPGRIGGLAIQAPARHDRRAPPHPPEDRPVTRLSNVPRRHDPYWDLDGTGARHQRTKQRVVKLAAWLVVVLILGFAATRLPAIDPEYLLHGAGRPILAGALLDDPRRGRAPRPGPDPVRQPGLTRVGARRSRRARTDDPGAGVRLLRTAAKDAGLGHRHPAVPLRVCARGDLPRIGGARPGSVVIAPRSSRACAPCAAHAAAQRPARQPGHGDPAHRPLRYPRRVPRSPLRGTGLEEDRCAP